MLRTITMAAVVMSVTFVAGILWLEWAHKHRVSFVCAVGYVTFCGVGNVPIVDANGNVYAAR